MSKKVRIAALICGLLSATGASCQTVTTSGGIAGSVPVYSGGTTLGSSNIFVANDMVGIGTSQQTAPLNVSGNVYIGGNYKGDASLHITGSQGSYGRLTELDGVWWNGIARNIMSSNDAAAEAHYWSWGLFQNEWMFEAGVWSQDGPPFAITNSGNVGIGTATPRGALEVHNNGIRLSAVNANLTFPDNSPPQITAWNGTILGGDYAESVDVVGDRATYEAGDVIAVDQDLAGRFARTVGAYSRFVAGIYSTRPGVVGRRTGVERPNKNAEVPLALLGIVPIKVSAENGIIEPGDLLVSSATPGFAMKGTDPGRLKGTVIGKAMGSLSSGEGLIEAIVMLP